MVRQTGTLEAIDNDRDERSVSAMATIKSSNMQVIVKCEFGAVDSVFAAKTGDCR